MSEHHQPATPEDIHAPEQGHGDLSRRRFLMRAASGSAFLTLGLSLPAPGGGRLFADERADGDEKVLVVLQLSGGNDGLNTVIPYRNDDYYRNRARIGIKKKDAFRLDDDYGLAPALEPLGRLWGDGQLAVVHGVGYPNPDKSHFRSMEIWHTGQPALEAGRGYGWLGTAIGGERARGRKLPGAYLGGGEMPLAMRDASASIPQIERLAGYGPKLTSDREKAALRAGAGSKASGNPALDFLRASQGQAFVAADELAKVAASYKPKAAYPDTGIGQGFKACAQIISAGLGARVLYLTLGGFDTHAGQIVAQPRLHGWLAAAIAAFHKDLTLQGKGEQVSTMVFSEFGRRVRENASLGTDHGTAGPVLLCGAGVNGGLYGQHPSLTQLAAGDLIHTTDYRRVYAAVLDGWLGVPSQPILKAKHQPLALFQ